MDNAPEQRYVGYPRKRSFDGADRLLALGYAEIAFTVLFKVSAVPVLMFWQTSFFSLAEAQFLGAAIFDFAIAVATYASYALLVRARACTRAYAISAAVAYAVVYYLALLWAPYSGFVIFFFGAVCIFAPGRKIARTELKKYGLPMGLTSWRGLKRAVEEQRLADRLTEAPQIPTELFSGEGPKTMA